MQSFRYRHLVVVLIAALFFALPLSAQEDGQLPKFGMEFEFAGKGNRIPVWENQSFENYEKIMRVIVEHYGGNPATIQKEYHRIEERPDGSERRLWQAKWTDPKGRSWAIEPEYVSSMGWDGYELVTPPLEDSKEVKKIITKLRDSGLVREGLKSGVHLHVDGARLIKPNGDATALVNLINMHEKYEPLLRRVFNPVRGGGHENRFAKSIVSEHPELLREINQLGPSERTAENLERIFSRYHHAEMRNRGFEELNSDAWKKMWKYHSLNLVNVLNINEVLPAEKKTVEFRMFDLNMENPETHRLASELYRRMVDRSVKLAEQGQTVRFEQNGRVPKGEDPSRFLLPEDPAEVKRMAREMVESFGGNPAEYEALLERNVKPYAAVTKTEFKRRMGELPNGRVEIKGKPVTFGWELEGRGDHVALLLKPTEAELASRWESLSDAEKMRHFRESGGSLEKFKPNTEKFPWLSDRIHYEYTGNWEIESKVFENMDKALENMRWVKEKMGSSSRGYHLHMRWQPEYEVYRAHAGEIADWFERAANAIFMKRLEIMKHALSMNTSWNKRYDEKTIRQIEEAIRKGENYHEKARTLAWRPGGSGENKYIDVEIRGLWTRVNDIDKLARLLVNSFKNHQWGDTRLSENLMPFDKEVGGKTLAQHIDAYMESVEGRKLNPVERRIIENLQNSSSEWARKTTTLMKDNYSKNLLTPLLGWENERIFEEPTRRTLRHKRHDYMRGIISVANNIQNGEYGIDLNSNTKEALVEKFGLSAADAEKVVRYRESLVNPQAEFDINRASIEELKRLNGVGDATARRVVEFREAGNQIASEADLERAGVRGRPAEILLEAMTRPSSAEPRFIKSVEEITGLSEAGREKIRQAGGVTELNWNEVFKQTRWRAKKWARDVRLSEKLFRSLMPMEGRENARTPDLRYLELDALKAEELKTELRLGEETVGMIERLRNEGKPVTAETLRNPPGTMKLETATVNELAEVEGLSRSDAEKIVRHRDALRSPAPIDLATASMEEIRAINGVGESTLERIREARESGNPLRTTADLERAGLSPSARSYLERAMNPGPEAGREIRRADLASVEGLSENARQALETRLQNNPKPASEADIERLLQETNMAMTNEMRERMPEGARLNPHRGHVTEMKDVISETIRGLSGSSNGNNVEVKVERNPEARARATTNYSGTTFQITTGMLDAIAEASQGMTEERAKKFREKAVMVMALEEVGRAREANFLERANEASFFEENRLSADELERLRNIATRTGREVPRTVSERLVAPGSTVTSNPSSTSNNTENFSNRRRNPRNRTTVEPMRISRGEVDLALSSIHTASETLLANGKLKAPAPYNNTSLPMGLEIVESNDLELKYDKTGQKMQVSTGLLNEIHRASLELPPQERVAFRRKALGLLFGHEYAHRAGIKAEGIADRAALEMVKNAPSLKRVNGVERPVTDAELKRISTLFSKSGTRLGNFLYGVKNFFRYGTTSGRARNLVRANRGVPDRLARFRRADGTLKWGQLTKSGALRMANGTAHFAFALFLKELATVAETGDRARIEEFFDGLMTTDFYVHYGLFSAGAALGDIGYTRYIQRHIKPKFVNGVMKSFVVLGVGMAIPELVYKGKLDKAFAISLTSLGLSSGAVKTAMAGVKGGMKVANIASKGRLARVGQKILAARRVAKVGGWVYTAAETAVVLYFGEKIEHEINDYLAERAARGELEDGAEKALELLGDRDIAARELEEALIEAGQGYAAWRNYLLRPVNMEQDKLNQRLAGVGQDALVLDEKRAAMRRNLEENEGLKRWIERRYGSMDDYLDKKFKEDSEDIAHKAKRAYDIYKRAAGEKYQEIFNENRRSSDYVPSRVRDREDFLDEAADDVSENLPQSYDDEIEFLRAVRRSVEDRPNAEELQQVVDDQIRIVQQVKQTQSEFFDIEVRGGTGITDRLTGNDD